MMEKIAICCRPEMYETYKARAQRQKRVDTNEKLYEVVADMKDAETLFVMPQAEPGSALAQEEEARRRRISVRHMTKDFSWIELQEAVLDGRLDLSAFA